MSVQRLGVGEHGEVKYRMLADGRVTASVYYRSGQGRLRRIEATGESRSAARRVALKSFERTAAAGGGAEYGRRTTFRDVAGDWLVSVEELAVAGRRSPRTAALYRHALERHVLPRLGELRLEELTTARIDWFVRERRRTHGYAVAKLCRSVTSGVCGFAVRRDAMRFNPVRDVGALEVVSERQPRAMTSDEVLAWLAILDRSEFAREHDLPDFVRFLLGTGCRLGEALALTWDGVDLERGLVSVSATLIRVRGQGMLSKRPKTRAGCGCCAFRRGWWSCCVSVGLRIRSRRGRCFRTRSVGIGIRTTWVVCIASLGRVRGSSGWCRTPTGRRWRRCWTGRV